MARFKTCEFTPGPLPDFELILKNWCKTVVRWCEQMEWEDVPWWYGERSSLGLFALAAWGVGAVPLEEYSTMKGKGGGSYTGRGDLLISSSKKRYIIEAKQKWISISNQAMKGQNKLEEAIHHALDGARDSTEFRGRRAGLVFVVPYLAEIYEEFTNERVCDFVGLLRKRDDCAVAWVFPEQARHEYKFNGYLYPGIAVLIRPLRRS